MAEASISIDGMSCMHCIMAVKKAVDGLKGVESSDVQVGLAKVKFDDSALKAADIEAAIAKAGYRIKK